MKNMCVCVCMKIVWRIYVHGDCVESICACECVESVHMCVSV